MKCAFKRLIVFSIGSQNTNQVAMLITLVCTCSHNTNHAVKHKSKSMDSSTLKYTPVEQNDIKSMRMTNRDFLIIIVLL